MRLERQEQHASQGTASNTNKTQARRREHGTARGEDFRAKVKDTSNGCAQAKPWVDPRMGPDECDLRADYNCVGSTVEVCTKQRKQKKYFGSSS